MQYSETSDSSFLNSDSTSMAVLTEQELVLTSTLWHCTEAYHSIPLCYKIILPSDHSVFFFCKTCS